MDFNKVINELTLDTGEVGNFTHKMTPEEVEKEEKKEKKKKRKKVFGSWFTNHNNSGHLNKNI